MERVTPKQMSAEGEAALATLNGARGADATWTEDRLALEFVNRHRDDFRWSPGLGWMLRTKNGYVRDEEKRRLTLARKVCRACADDGAPSEKRRLGSARTVMAVLKLSESDERIIVPAEKWDVDARVLNTPEGVIDLRTGRLRQRTPSDYLTQCTTVTPDANMASPEWQRFLTEVFSRDQQLIEFVQRVFGYCLTGDRSEQKMFFFHGDGANGKSTLIDLVMGVIGGYALKLPSNVLMHSVHERHPTELAQLRGRRLAVSSELEEGCYWAESRLKELTGDDTITARFMRQDNFELKLTHKHLISGNYKPRLRGGDPAMARRMVLIPFNREFSELERDPAMLQKLRGEAPAVLAWMIEGARKWYESGLQIPSSVQEASREYMADHDDLAQWLDESCEKGPEHSAWASEAYKHFQIWKANQGERVPTQKEWGGKLSKLSEFKKVKSNGVMRYRGFRLNDEARRQIGGT